MTNASTSRPADPRLVPRDPPRLRVAQLWVRCGGVDAVVGKDLQRLPVFGDDAASDLLDLLAELFGWHDAKLFDWQFVHENRGAGAKPSPRTRAGSR